MSRWYGYSYRTEWKQKQRGVLDLFSYLFIWGGGGKEYNF